MIPSCFSHPNTTLLSPTSLSHDPQSLITCIYQTHLCNSGSDSPVYLTLTWFRSLSSHSLSLHASDCFSTTLSLYPSSTFSFFRPRPTSKSIYLTHRHGQKLKLHWDFSRAKYTPNSAQPDSCFFLAISCNGKLEFFLGDLVDEFARRSRLVLTRPVKEETLLSRREHVFGRRNYVSRAEFLGSQHEIGVELCGGGGVLKVTVDGEIKLTVKRLAWKFRGNERFFIGGNAVDFFWDVFNWVKNNEGFNGNEKGNGNGHGVFVFQVGEGAIWPEVVGAEVKLMKKCLSLSATGIGSAQPMALPSLSPTASCSSVLQWAEESSDGGRSSCSSSSRSSGSHGGFSLLLYAWRKDKNFV